MQTTVDNKERVEWDEQELSSDSEVTLVNFNSELLEEDEDLKLSLLLEVYPIDDRKNFIINRDKGEVIDMRTGGLILQFKTSNAPRPQSVHVINPSPENQQNKGRTKTSTIEAVIQLKRQSIDQTNAEDNGWDDYWQQSEKIHQKLLKSICQKDHHFFNELFNKKFNPYPININYRSFDNWTPLHFAALHGNIVALETLLGMPDLFLHALTNFKWSALHVAVKNNKSDAAKLLLDARIDPNLQDEDSYTALHYAVELGHKELVSLLLKNQQIDKTITNNRGLTAQQLCSSRDIMNVFEPDPNQQKGGKYGFLNTFARNNRHIEKLLGLGQISSQTKPTEVHSAKEVTHKLQRRDSRKEEPKKMFSRKENIVKMYQLLKEKRPVERIGIDSFKFYKKIGQGAFGEVYIVKKGKSDKLYALKAIKKQKILGTNIMRYIQTEKEVLSLINHPFIVHLHFAFQTETHLFLVMDYCEGGDLGKFLEKKKKFDENTVRNYAAEILLALEALHQEKIIYRDMKPDNIVLDPDGHALLTDFGLSKKTTSIDDINKSFCGTPAYLPLQIINKKGHNRMADWYEYGVVLYELYTGIPPFFAETKAELYQNVRTGIIRFPRGTPELFRDLIKKLLSQNPEKRLGFTNDAQSIKQHKWFEGMNWEKVYNRELQMPKIENKLILGEAIKTKFIEERTDKYLVSGWSFIAG